MTNLYRLILTHAKIKYMKTSRLIYLLLLIPYIGISQSENTTTIGAQTWSMNLNATSFKNGEPIPKAQSNAEWEAAVKNKQPAWCYHKNDPSKAEKHGLLYNWFTVNDARGIAPEGWRVASKQDWETLLSNYQHNRAKALKTKEGWKVFYGNNSSGFSAYPVGIRGVPNFFQRGETTIYWTSTELDEENAYGFAFTSSKRFVFGSQQYKVMGYSVRLVKN
jgi:uncharacterized protein (TIGR02145 family)